MNDTVNNQSVNEIYNISRLLAILLYIIPCFVILISCKSERLINASDVILLINSNTQGQVAITKVIPYLNHYGVKYEIVDVAKGLMPSKEIDPSLIIIGHSEIVINNDLEVKLEQYLKICQERGTGILSFDPLIPSNLLSIPVERREKDKNVGKLRFSEESHYITEFKQPGEVKDLFGYMSIPNLLVDNNAGKVIIKGNELPLLVVGKQGKGNIAQWTSQDWMYYSILGPMGGLDDCLWKSIVWAARKPFLMQAFPSIVTMRVDDVVGSGRQQWDVTPFQWIKIANKHGFKPWVGLFIYNITPEGIEELRELMSAGLVTGTPHAFGRPPRKESSIEVIKRVYNPYYAPQMAATHFVPDYWYKDAIPYQSEYYDEFIFFDHNYQKPWSTEISKKNLQAVDDWYRTVGISMGNYFVPHWGEMGSEMITHIQDIWGIEFIEYRELDKSWGQQALEYALKDDEQLIRSSPFKLYDEPEIGRKKENYSSTRASYNAEFRKLSGRTFFDFSSIIYDITGFDWAPDNNVEETALRGIKTLERGLESKALAVLFTHETDYIYAVKPDNWDAILEKISKGISGYNPLYMDMDEALLLLRSYMTSEILDGMYDTKTRELNIKMSGKTDVPTSVYVFTDCNGSVNEELVKIPVFQDEIEINVKVN